MTKKYFGTDGIRGRVGQSLINPEFILKLGWAVGKVLGKKKGGVVLIGKDTRVSGYLLESALEAGLSASGMDVLLLGPMPTPAISYLTRTLRAEAGIVISASHNGFEDNGIKFFNSKGMKLSDEWEAAIEELLDEPLKTVSSKCLGKAERLHGAADRYIEFCKRAFPTSLSLKGLKIVVDAAHGATYHIAPKVFHELGATVVSIGCQPNGFNINENAGALHLANLQKTVVEEKADLGIALDGDGDRIMMIDHEGKIVDGDHVLYSMANHIRQTSEASFGIVGTLMTNYALELALKNMSVDFYRANVGDRFVLEAMLERGWTLGGENSGHIVNLKYATTGDGIISALQVLTVMLKSEKTLQELMCDLIMCPQVLINVPITRTFSLENYPVLQKHIQQVENKLAGQGRLLLRPSGTEPLVRVMVEGYDELLVNQLAKELADNVSRQMES